MCSQLYCNTTTLIDLVLPELPAFEYNRRETLLDHSNQGKVN